MNTKMTSVADEIGHSIFKYYDEDYLDVLFATPFLSIEDVIFQILIECCRYSFLVNLEKHSLKYYCERDGKDYQLYRQYFQRTLQSINKKFDLLSEKTSESSGYQPLKPNVDFHTDTPGRYPSYSISEYQYWEACDVHDSELIRTILSKQIASSKKVSEDRFVSMIDTYDKTIKALIEDSNLKDYNYVLNSIKFFTIESKYAFEFYYSLANEMEKAGIHDIPDLYDRIMAFCGNVKYSSNLLTCSHGLASDLDQMIEYPMVLQRFRFIKNLITAPIDSFFDFNISQILEANVLANAVQSHIYLNGLPMRQWFAENVNTADCAEVFRTYNIFGVFNSVKTWTRFKMQQVRKIYKEVSIDYKSLQHPEKRP